MTQLLTIAPETPQREIEKKFEKLRAHQFAVGNTTYAQRRKKLQKLHRAILRYRPQMKEAAYKDYGKHPSEVDLTEVYPITSEIKHTKRHLRGWMEKQSVGTPLSLLGSSSYIKYEPKGVVLIISPWNFPFNLTFCPLVSAIAAGNVVMLKPSEHTPHSSALMKTIIAETFEEEEVTLVEGGIETSKSLLNLPFNHIFFTGAPSIGKIVMKAAAQHLCSVTLELGGKSPTIIDQSANLDIAARRIAWGKFFNNGQVCIAPDYVFVHQSVKESFIAKVRQYIQKFYTDNAAEEPSYARIVNQRHFHRIKSMLDDALQKGAKAETGNQVNETENYIAPTVLTNVPMESKLMQEEIFGPLLPVHSFQKLEEVTSLINEGEKPLALYIYSRSKKNINYLLDNTRAGGGCINHSAVHFFNANLPFGGSNNSGIGKAHGWFGFHAFSNQRGILKQHIPNFLEVLFPPYNDVKQKLIDIAIKYF
ncbi:MAG: aldehyde dehydrogenase family protein [Bacteroidota bacterium]